ncbi:hypothetical protein HII36_24865 [Nonomuraea sp. NN258]|uniref:baeRF2 domain-containing protein n=1 Tax=Nonomuraea antri TaxID=2730852 RepID=UPI001568D1F9|nr:Vms1/Ankzf1 family peptidyl-tRNA hydrolase [Nonomuraea antri]NRQ35029.1 hypothetical protein [Nonomuraea antri]
MRLDFIRPLYERRGPYASVYLGAITRPERETHWHSVRDQLDHADPGTMDVLETEALKSATGRAIFATHGEVVLAESLDTQPYELGMWAPLPHVTPMLRYRGENVPHIRVIMDHAGAEVTVFGGGSPRKATIEAQDWPLQKTAQGGWSQTRYERGVEDSWEKNAEAVAHVIDEQVRRLGIELIIIAGEPKSRSYLLHHLGTQAADRVMMVEHGSRSNHGQFAEDAEKALDDWLGRKHAELLDRHAESAGPVGLSQVAQALRDGRVHAVLTPGELPQEIWIGEGGAQLSTDPAELRRWGVDEPVKERADSALARATAMTDAELWFTDQVSDVAAVLRY